MKDFNSSGRLTEEKYLKLKNIYPKIDSTPICAIIENAERKFDFFLTDEYFLTLVTHLVISVARLSSGKSVEECFLPPEANYTGLERKTAEYIASGIEAEYSLEFPESERIYICIHLMSYNTFNNVEKSNSNDAIKNIPKKVELLAICLIDYVDAQLGTSFASDKLLFFGIIFHLNSSIRRLEENIPIRTVPRDEVLNTNEEIFNAVSRVSNLYEGICSVKPDEEELIALTMHFALSHKRNIRKKKALLVCNSGVSDSIALCSRLSGLLPELEMVDVCSSFQLAYKAENEYDFIISTVPLEGAAKPVADLTHVAESNYCKFLEEFMFSVT